jgi:hypothetical protein
VDQAHKNVAHVRAVAGLVEQGVLAMQDCFLYRLRNPGRQEEESKGNGPSSKKGETPPQETAESSSKE